MHDPFAGFKFELSHFGVIHSQEIVLFIRVTLTILIVCTALSNAFCVDAAPPDIFVAPNGKDAWSGASPTPGPDNAGPFATPQRAVKAVRVLKEKLRDAPRAIRVGFAGGTYFLTEPWVLTPEDSGTKTMPITYAAIANDVQPVFSGGIKLTGFTVDAQRHWHTIVPAPAQGGVGVLGIVRQRAAPFPPAFAGRTATTTSPPKRHRPLPPRRIKATTAFNSRPDSWIRTGTI